MYLRQLTTIRFSTSVLCVLAALTLAGCGGGGGGGTVPEPTVLPLALPTGHGLPSGEITVAPGESEEHGNVVLSCPAGGQACVLNVAADGSASYDRTGGMPSVMPALAAQTLPPGHGLSAGDISVAAGQSMEQGNVVISCPAGGSACVLNVAADGSASYDRTGGMPSVMPAFAAQTLPPDHGLSAGDISVAAGQSMKHGNVVISCPAGGSACVLNVAADGSASYARTGGMPSVMSAFAAQTLPPGHGLSAGDITVAAGQSMEHGNVVISCPAGGSACVLNVAADGSASYDRTGGMPALRILPLMAGPGQNLSDASPVLATDETSTLKATLADPANVIPALSTTLARHRGDRRATELTTDFFVKSIRRNANGEYVVDYVLDGADGQVTIPNNAVDCTNACRVTVNERTFSFWNATTNDDDMASFEDGLGEYEYFASHRIFYQPEDVQSRLWFVFGIRNEELPMGTATYHGEFDTRTWKAADPDSDQRQYISGNMRIVANFDMRALEGRVYRIRGVEPGGDTRSTWPTSSFTLTNGRIVNGQFTATLTGVDSDPNTPLDESVRDFIGHVLGEFYGPNAEEVGGVVSATRDVVGTADDRVLYGFIGGRKTDRLTGVNDSEAVSVGFDRDDVADTMTLRSLGSPTVESTADGYTITYVVDGQTQTLEFTESDFGANLGRPTQYSKTTNGTEYRLFTTTESFYDDRIFWGTISGVRRIFRPEHFDVNGWVIVNRDASDTLTSVRWGRIVYGNRTTDMPTTGTASYEGGAFILESPNDRAVSTSDPDFMYYRADAALSADFGSSAVTGNFTLREARPGDGTWGAPASGGLSFNAMIDGNGFSATDLSGSGDLAGYSGGVNGAFYGPEAAETAGVFDAVNNTENKHLIGEFGGQKQ